MQLAGGVLQFSAFPLRTAAPSAAYEYDTHSVWEGASLIHNVVAHNEVQFQEPFTNAACVRINGLSNSSVSLAVFSEGGAMAMLNAVYLNTTQ